MPKPTPKSGTRPTASPAAVPPHTRAEAERTHPWDPAPAPPEQPAEPPARPDGPADAREPGSAPRRPGGRPRARARGKSLDLGEWSRQVSGSALKVAAARRKLSGRENELADLVARARAAGVGDDVLTAWLIAAGLGAEDLHRT